MKPSGASATASGSSEPAVTATGSVTRCFSRDNLPCRIGSFDEAHERLGEARNEFDASGLASDIRLVDARTAECLVFEGRSPRRSPLSSVCLRSGAAGLSAEMALLQRVRTDTHNERR